MCPTSYQETKTKQENQDCVSEKANPHSFVNKETAVGALNMRQISFWELGPLETRAAETGIASKDEWPDFHFLITKSRF